MRGLTLDTGALIGFERGDRRVFVHLKRAMERGQDLTIPTAVLAEGWRGGSRSARLARLLDGCSIEPLFENVARAAGEAMGAIEGASVIDAIVMSSGALRGDDVLTADVDDLDRLRGYFRSVRIFRI
jgi:predicted nucleic acid-binding protein